MRALWALPFAAAMLAGVAHADGGEATEAPVQQHPVVDAPVIAQPLAEVKEIGRGLASWYGKQFHGRKTASGERFDMNAHTAAHRTLPFGTVIEVHSLVNGRVVEVRVNDRGPFLRKRIIDLSRGAAEALGLIESGAGVKQVVLRVRKPAKSE